MQIDAIAYDFHTYTRMLNAEMSAMNQILLRCAIACPRWQDRHFPTDNSTVNCRFNHIFHICNPIVNMQILQYVIIFFSGSSCQLTVGIHGNDDTEDSFPERVVPNLPFANETNRRERATEQKKKSANEIIFSAKPKS